MKLSTIAIVLGLLGVTGAVASPAGCPVECFCGDTTTAGHCTAAQTADGCFTAIGGNC
ncbi:hypothetical protein DL93DRAFT_2091339 [Clavulina sp. PMI_390]|nr:hypothetical protein DL93DRAFT_2091339 [Clavulina sp. PMI_390]